MRPGPLSIPAKEGRFARLEAIEWWNQSLLARTRALVIGAGALGNEVIKNLALLGVGQVFIVDMDHVELSNLSRSVLFREQDEGRSKAACAARAAQQINPGLNVKTLAGNVLADLGLGHFRWADVVIGALDNREARVFVNSACAQLGRPWFDGGIEVFQGIVRGFAPPRTACYECTMSRVDWDLLNQRRSCSLLARRALAERGTPTTPTTASVIAGIQVAEIVKYLHGLDALVGCGLVFDGAHHGSYRVNYPIHPECPWHEPPPPVESVIPFNSDSPFEGLWIQAERRLGKVDAIDLAREIVESLACPSCARTEPVFLPAEKIAAEQLLCPVCQQECAPVFRHTLGTGSGWLKKTPREIGLPLWDIVWARRGTHWLGLEIAGDNPWANHSPAINDPER
jgi:molybdopterin/thiamine biosynthesis adenylyltransferase